MNIDFFEHGDHGGGTWLMLPGKTAPLAVGYRKFLEPCGPRGARTASIREHESAPGRGGRGLEERGGASACQRRDDRLTFGAC